MKKAMRKMIPAVIMLLISAMLVGTSTYAWFSMNKTVTVTGMTVKAKGTDNVMISSAAATEGRVAESSFTYGIDQTRTGNLQPASSIDGETFYYTNTKNVLANGAVRTPTSGTTYTQYTEATTAASNSNSGKSYIDTAFNTNYGITSPDATTEVYAYIDYSFYIKATNAKTSTQALRMSQCNLLYNNAAIANGAKAWRVALFAVATDANASGVAEVADASAAVAGNLKSILALADAAYFTSGKAVDDATPTMTTVTNLSTAAKIADVTAGTTAYYKVVVRLWLEGEDTTCKNDTFASLSGDWTLDLAFALDESTGVTAIGSVATTTVTGADTATGTAALNVSGETAATYQWFATGGTNVTTDAAGNASYTKEETGTASYYCVITTQKGSKYRTADVSLTKAE